MNDSKVENHEPLKARDVSLKKTAELKKLYDAAEYNLISERSISQELVRQIRENDPNLLLLIPSIINRSQQLASLSSDGKDTLLDKVLDVEYNLRFNNRDATNQLAERLIRDVQKLRSTERENFAYILKVLKDHPFAYTVIEELISQSIIKNKVSSANYQLQDLKAKPQTAEMVIDPSDGLRQLHDFIDTELFPLEYSLKENLGFDTHLDRLMVTIKNPDQLLSILNQTPVSVEQVREFYSQVYEQSNASENLNEILKNQIQDAKADFLVVLNSSLEDAKKMSTLKDSLTRKQTAKRFRDLA